MEKEMSDNFVLLRELLETKMEHLNEKIDIHNNHVVERLDFIKEQTAKTNGRVLKAEEEIDNIYMEFNKIETNHLLNCPKSTEIESMHLKIEKINEENLIVKVFNKYPRQLLSILVITVILSMLTMGYTAYKVRDTVRKIKSSEVITKNELPKEVDRQ